MHKGSISNGWEAETRNVMSARCNGVEYLTTVSKKISSCSEHDIIHHSGSISPNQAIPFNDHFKYCFQQTKLSLETSRMESMAYDGMEDMKA